ncbi:hypothetical protein BKP45_12515 [Anaerobacillus alkalidiazotrophicus]|uniref:Uncharacterized protein n=1 Tax=Anaerobacillus alkalidiazotrophicus TaxID=472963 RepID=A0A1S2M5C2_9BACI|nr:hypothetical protein [Anaerobacillus alkalidiazotrophicus]OIJ18392.1 hypothetical protein BKP45_18230 [Anaerobacillus alkalidiazotrophicus]OIJ19871.1 hypothetical protein BKP45_12515 [Anaerobacillus alkalidiazotrophicus]
MKKNYKNLLKKQLRSIMKETDNPAIIQDVTDTEFGVIPGDFEKQVFRQRNKDNNVTRNSTDGKTWNDIE